MVSLVLGYTNIEESASASFGKARAYGYLIYVRRRKMLGHLERKEIDTSSRV